MNNKYELIYEGKAKKVFSHDDKDKVIIELKMMLQLLMRWKKLNLKGRASLIVL